MITTAPRATLKADESGTPAKRSAIVRSHPRHRRQGSRSIHSEGDDGPFTSRRITRRLNAMVAGSRHGKIGRRLEAVGDCAVTGPCRGVAEIGPDGELCARRPFEPSKGGRRCLSGDEGFVRADEAPNRPGLSGYGGGGVRNSPGP
jgi:hypothetical protein